jgi:hypothetical protein
MALTCGVAFILAASAGCSAGPPVDVRIVVDGQTYTVAMQVVCTKFPDDKLLIYASPSDLDATKRIRLLLSTAHRLVVHAAGFRLPEANGFTNDDREMEATKVDDTYTVSGRMPPADGQFEWRQFEIVAPCPGYAQPEPGDLQPALGEP